MKDHVFPRCLSIQMVRRKQLVTIRRADGLSVLNVRRPELQFLDFGLARQVCGPMEVFYMITILSGLFIKNRDQFGNSDVRRAYGMLCSIVGIALNVFLFAGKYLAGVISGSIAITADAFNNLSDAGSSLYLLWGLNFPA